MSNRYIDKLFDVNGTPDFGLSKPLENEEDRTKTVAGTLIWMVRST